LSIPEHAQGSALNKLEDAWRHLSERPYPRKSADPGVAALFDELRQLDIAMAERLRALIAGQPVHRLDFLPPEDFLERLEMATKLNSAAANEARDYIAYMQELYQILRFARLLTR